MPFAHVHLRSGRTAAQKKAILDGLHAALVEAFSIPESDRNQLVHEHPPEDFEARHGPEAVFVEISIFPGRSAEAKRLLYRAVVRKPGGESPDPEGLRARRASRAAARELGGPRRTGRHRRGHRLQA